MIGAKDGELTVLLFLRDAGQDEGEEPKNEGGDEESPARPNVELRGVLHELRELLRKLAWKTEKNQVGQQKDEEDEERKPRRRTASEVETPPQPPNPQDRQRRTRTTVVETEGAGTTTTTLPGFRSLFEVSLTLSSKPFTASSP